QSALEREPLTALELKSLGERDRAYGGRSALRTRSCPLPGPCLPRDAGHVSPRGEVCVAVRKRVPPRRGPLRVSGCGVRGGARIPPGSAMLPTPEASRIRGLPACDRDRCYGELSM